MKNLAGIIDYGMGNLYSVQNALKKENISSALIQSPDQLPQFDRLILPGVGAFGDAMENLNALGLTEPLLKAVAGGVPLLGICLGMQVLFSESEELGHHHGLDVLPGNVRYLRVAGKVPHMGWNEMTPVLECPLLDGLPEQTFVYFANSYVVHPGDETVIAGTTEYEINFPSVVWQKNVYGVQFHPEKSQQAGLKILRNFVERC